MEGDNHLPNEFNQEMHQLLEDLEAELSELKIRWMKKIAVF